MGKSTLESGGGWGARLPTATRLHIEDPAPATRRRPATSLALGHYGSDAAPPPQIEVPSPDPTESAAKEQAPASDQTALAYPSLHGPNSPAIIRKYWTKSSSSNIYTLGPSFGTSSKTRLIHQHSTASSIRRTRRRDRRGRELLRTRGRQSTRSALLSRYEREDQDFLERLPAFSKTATGEPNTDFYSEYPVLTELLDQPNTIQAVKHYLSTNGVFATEPIFQLTAMALNTTQSTPKVIWCHNVW